MDESIKMLMDLAPRLEHDIDEYICQFMNLLKLVKPNISHLLVLPGTEYQPDIADADADYMWTVKQ
jgi:hypothetical protein